MSIKYNEATKTCSIDAKTYHLLKTGTPFQKSMIVLNEMDQIGYEIACDAANAFGLTGLARKAFLKKMHKQRMKDILKSKPPGIDPDALEVFCK